MTFRHPLACVPTATLQLKLRGPQGIGPELHPSRRSSTIFVYVAEEHINMLRGTTFPRHLP